MEDSNKVTELHAAYLCLKESSAEDLLTLSELKHVFHYAGFSPPSDFLEKVWTERKNENISFNDFCAIADNLQALDENEIKKIIHDVFIVNGDSISISDLKSLPLMLKRESSISDFDIDLLVNEIGGKNGLINVNTLCKLISKTIKEVKNVALQNLEEKAFDQRINRRTFTKKQLAMKLHSYGKSNSIEVQDWFSSTLKGSLFIDDELIIVHHYALEIPCIGPTVIKITPLKFRSTVLTVDILAFIFRESVDGNKIYIGYTNIKNEDGSNYWIDTLKEGKYLIIPYTTGCIKKKTKDESKAIQLLKKESKIELTPDCLRLLEDIFYQMDLDGNNLLNRQEFNLYNWRTSGETVQDDEWEVVQSNFDVENGEVTLKGFLSLHQLEAEDNGGDVEDLWVSLETIGYNRYGYQEKCCPFSLTVYSQSSSPKLIVSGLKSGGLLLDKAVIRSVMEESDPISICEKEDLFKYELIKEERACIVVQNKSTRNFVIRIDCSESVNCFSNRESLIWEGEIEKKSAVIVHHLAPINTHKQWSVSCVESVIDE